MRRLAAVTALVLAGLAASPQARAQGFFSFFQPSPRDIVDRLDEQGFNVRLPMVRRGDVYIVDAVDPSRRSVRLIVSARDGHVLERYAAAPRWRDEDSRSAHWRDDDADRDEFDGPRWERRTRTALGDPVAPPSRFYDRDDDFGARPTPPAPLTDDAPRHKPKKHTPVAKDAPDAAPKPAPSVAAVAPSQPAPPKADAPAAPKIIEVPQAKAEAKPARSEEAPAPRVIPLTPAAPAPVKAEEPVKSAPVAQAEPKPTPAPAPAKPEPPRKKLNDLPVGTLD